MSSSPRVPHCVARRHCCGWAWRCAWLGLIANRMWEALPFPRFFEHLLIGLFALAAAWPLVRWRDWPWATALALVWLAGLVVFAGPMPVFAVAVLAAAAVAVGSLLMPGPIALPLGLALIAGVLGWLLPLQIHFRAVYAVACVALIAWRRAEVGAACHAPRRTVRGGRARISSRRGRCDAAGRRGQHRCVVADHAVR